MRGRYVNAGRLFGMLSLATALVVIWPMALALAAEAPDDSDTGKVAITDKERSKSKTVMILGVSWHAGFCEGRPKARECQDQTTEARSATHFSLHGLWRMRKSYCGVPTALKEQDKKRKWLELPELSLEEDLKVELAKAMPGMASGLERHEWVKHGTCSGAVATDYYSRSLKLLDAMNASEVRVLFQDNLGKTLGEATIKAAFDSAFGTGAGDKIKMRCRKDGDRRVITGLTIGLGEVDDDRSGDLTALIAAAGRTKFGCPEGVVDEAGFQ